MKYIPKYMIVYVKMLKIKLFDLSIIIYYLTKKFDKKISLLNNEHSQLPF